MSRDERLRALESLRVPAVASLSQATLIRLGHAVGAAQLVLGACEVTGDTLTVRARVIWLESGRRSAEIVESGPLTNLFEIHARVARRLVGDTAPEPDTQAPAPPVAAFEQYIKGLVAEAPVTRISFLREALRLDPSLHRARIAIWDVYTALGEHESALAAARRVPAGGGLAREATFLSSISLLHMARYQDAFDTLTTLNGAAPDASLLNNLGIVQLRRSPDAAGPRAVSYFTQAVALTEGQHPDLLFNLGYAHWLERDLSNAVQSLREAVRRNPADHAAHYVLGVALQTMGHSAEGARERELARRLSSDYAEWEATQPAPNTAPKGLERLQTDLAVRPTRRVEAEIVAAGQRNQQELAAFHIDAGRRAHLAERDDEAIASLRRAVYLSPYDAEAHLLLGRAYLRGGRLAESIDAFTISIWSGESLAARLGLAQAYVLTQNTAAARGEIEIVLSRDPTNVEANRLLAGLPPE
jgi:tetratricopeptide (TPR) repeat protein